MSTQGEKLKAIADAIREKDGTTAPILANDFPERIRAIETGGKLPEDICTISLTADPPEGGSVSGGGLASEGMTLTVNAETSEGYNFTDWKENGQTVSEDVEYTFVVSEDRALVAVFAEVPASRLPDGYIEVEYIESGNGAYIDTGVKPTTTTKLTMEVEPLSAGGTSGYLLNSHYASGTTTSSPFYGFRVIYVPGSKSVQGLMYNGTYGSVPSASTIKSGIEPGTKVTVAGDYPDKKIYVDDNFASFTRNSVSTNMGSITLLSLKASGTKYYVNAKLFSCQIEIGGEIVRDFVPCIDPTGAVGLYDLSGGAFYKNANTAGTFTPGPAV